MSTKKSNKKDSNSKKSNKKDTKKDIKKDSKKDNKKAKKSPPPIPPSPKRKRSSSRSPKKYEKKTIPKAVREQVWIQNFGKCFEHKCYVKWCKNKINVFNYQVGHDKPESKGGTLDLKNLKPICSRCNSSMSNNYTIKEWVKLCKKKSNRCSIL